MKLHEMSAEELRNALCRLAGPVGRIAEDARAGEALDALADADIASLPLATGLSRLIAAALPLLLQAHWADVTEIAAVLCGKTPAEMRAQSGLALVADVTACLQEELAAFFPCAAGSARTT